MPYGIDKDLGGDSPENTKWMEDCVEKVMNQGNGKIKSILICKNSFRKMKDKAKASFFVDLYLKEITDE